LTLNWHDFRLKYVHLKNLSSLNTLTELEKENIWFPRVTFLNTKASSMSQNDKKAFMFVQRKAQPDYNELKELESVDLFSGEANPVIISRTYNVEWLCHYQMGWYPFDTQICSMEFRAYGNSRINIEIVEDILLYSGPMELTQYFVRRSNMTSRLEDEAVVVTVTLGRRLLGTALTVYIPTILMIFISQATNYFKPFFFEAIVTVNLTVMLVLTTMFLSISKSLPATSYVKMVDLWLIFNLSIPFILVLMHTYIDHIRNDDEEDRVLDEKGVLQVHEGAKGVGLNNWVNGGENSGRASALSTIGNLVSVHEPEQQKALKDLYKHLANNIIGSRKKKLKLCLWFIHWGVPILALIFTSLYWYFGILHYFEII